MSSEASDFLLSLSNIYFYFFSSVDFLREILFSFYSYVCVCLCVCPLCMGACIGGYEPSYTDAGNWLPLEGQCSCLSENVPQKLQVCE